MRCGDCGAETEMRGNERVCTNPTCGARVRVRKVRKATKGVEPRGLRYTGGGVTDTCHECGNYLPECECDD